MTDLTPADLRHLAAIVKAERAVYNDALQAFNDWLPLVQHLVLDDVAVVAATIDPDRSRRAQDAWEAAIEPVVATLAALWLLRYKRKGKNKQRMAAALARYRAAMAERLAGVTSHAYKGVSDLVTDLRRQGKTDEQIRSALIAHLNPESYASDAARISRTSVMSAYNDGAEQGFRDFAAATGQEVTKTWRSLLDGKTRPTHLDANGQTVGLDSQFEVGGYFCQHPGDDSLPVWEAANCRCIATFKIGGIVASAGMAHQYRVERSAGRSTYGEWVVLDGYGRVMGHHPSKAMAFLQQRALDVAGDGVFEDAPPSGNDPETITGDGVAGDAVVASAIELPTGWRGPIAALDRLTGDDRWLATPPDGLRTRMLPMTVTRGHVSGDKDVFIGTMEAAWVQDGMLWAEGSFDLEGTDGAEAARLVGDHLLFTMSIDPDQVIAEQRLVDDAGNMAPDAVLEKALNTGAIPEGFRPVMVFTDWRLSSVALVSIPAYDEARIEPVFDYVRPAPPSDDHSDGAMIALRPVNPEAFAVDGGLDVSDLHVTLRYLGKAADIPMAMVPGLHAAAGAAALALNGSGHARVAGYGQLGDEGATVLFLNGLHIAQAHKNVELALEGDSFSGLPEPHSPFLAHMTLGYGIDPTVARAYVGKEFDFAGASFDHGAVRTDYPAVKPEPETAAPIIASVGGQVYTKAFFERTATGPTALTVDEDGSVYGHVRLYGTCYQYGGGQGDGGYCVEPPMSACNYEKFHVHGAKMDDGSIMAVGALTYGEGHESRGGLYASQAHYNNVATIAAKLRATEDEWGVWVAGEVCDDHRDVAYDVLLSPMSGHWEPDADNDGHLEMLAAHIVVTPGYKVPRRIVASFDDAGNATHLVIPSPWQNRTDSGTEVLSDGQKRTENGSLGAKDFRRAEKLAARAGVDRASRAQRLRDRLTKP